MCATLSVSAPRGAPQIRVLIADRNRLDSQLLGESLERDARFRVVGVPASSELLAVAASSKPDVALISADLDGVPRKGLQVARILSSRQPDINITILLDVSSRDAVVSAFRSGARAVFCRSAGLSDFRNCVERVSRGEIWASSVETEFLLDAVRRGPSCDTIDSEKLGKLSKREMQVAELAVQGGTNKQIADQLRLSEHTVKNYLFRAFEKLGVSTRMELLFLLSNQANESAHRAPALAIAPPVNPMEECTRAAEEGSVAAQFIVGLGYLEGRGFPQDDCAAYYWLRMAEKNSSRLQGSIRSLFETLRARLKPEEIEDMERRIALKRGQLLTARRRPDSVPHEAENEMAVLAPARTAARQK
jgi:DNA-binding NarL/FixJ family response regulator